MGGLKDVEVGGPIVETTSSYLVFTKERDFTALSSEFDEALEGMERDGTLKRLINAYTLPLVNVPSRE